MLYIAIVCILWSICLFTYNRNIISPKKIINFPKLLLLVANLCNLRFLAIIYVHGFDRLFKLILLQIDKHLRCTMMHV